MNYLDLDIALAQLLAYFVSEKGYTIVSVQQDRDDPALEHRFAFNGALCQDSQCLADLLMIWLHFEHGSATVSKGERISRCISLCRSGETHLLP